MRRWITSFVPSNRKPDPVAPAAPPMAGPSGQPAGIDHLMANPAPRSETVEATEADPYGSLMPIRRLSIAMDALPQAPASPDVSHAETSGLPEAPVEAILLTDAPGEIAPSGQVSPKVLPVLWQTLHDLAVQARDQGEHRIAADWWWLMRLGFPQIFYGYTDGALALAALDKHDEGRRLLRDAAARFPEEPAISVTAALLETTAGNMDAAIACWRASMGFAASPWWTCTRLLELLEQQSKHEEAYALLAESIRDPRFQKMPVLEKSVWAAVARQDWPAVAERLTLLGNTCSDDDILGLTLEDILIPMRTADPAAFEVVIRAPWIPGAIASPQTDPHRLMNQARLAQLCGHKADAMARLATLRSGMPQTAEAYRRIEAILRDAGFPTAADAVLAEADARLIPSAGSNLA